MLRRHMKRLLQYATFEKHCIATSRLTIHALDKQTLYAGLHTTSRVRDKIFTENENEIMSIKLMS